MLRGHGLCKAPGVRWSLPLHRLATLPAVRRVPLSAAAAAPASQPHFASACLLLRVLVALCWPVSVAPDQPAGPAAVLGPSAGAALAGPLVGLAFAQCPLPAVAPLDCEPPPTALAALSCVAGQAAQSPWAVCLFAAILAAASAVRWVLELG